MKRVKNGVANNVLPEDAPVHNWYRFVLSFPPHLVRDYLSKFGVDRFSRVLDPFCGTGTTPVECKKHGIPSVGLEANPMAYFASRIKTTWDIDPEALLTDSLNIAEIAREEIQRSGVDGFSDLPIFASNNGHGQLRDLTEEQWKVLSRAFISPLPLHRTLILLEAVRSSQPKPWTGYQELSLAKSLVSSIGNVAFGPEIGATAPRDDADVISIWLRECKQIARDLQRIESDLINVESCIIKADAREIQLKDKSIDFVITSPPYPNEKDYTRTTRLESVILGFIRSRSDLRQLKQELLRSNSRNVFVADNDDRWVQQISSVTQLARQIEERRTALGKTSGFERLYHRVVSLYFGGMMRHLATLKPVLRPGAKLAYVVGDQMSYFRVPIRTGQILAEIAEFVGYQVDSIDLFRTRLATATKEWIREEVVVLSMPA